MRLHSLGIGALLILAGTAHTLAQEPLPLRIHPDRGAATSSDRPPSNSVAHLSARGTLLWAGSSKGLARTADGGRTWESYRGNPTFARPGIFAVAVRGDTVWTSTGYVKDVSDQGVQTGDGYAFSTDNGSTWTRRGQTIDGPGDSLVTYGANTVRFLPVVVPEQNVTFDIALADSQVWVAGWASGLRRSSDLGATWTRTVLPSDTRDRIAPTDSLEGYRIDPRRDNNFLAFSVYVENDSTVWAGSAGGVNRSSDGGLSWRKFTTRNQLAPILGNWVIAIAGQPLAGGGTRIWITNWKADLDPNEEFGISATEDDGRTWRTFLQGARAYAFAVKDSTVYVATDDGIYRTADAGRSWMRSGSILDPVTRQRITSRTFYSVAVVGDTLFAGGRDGIVRTPDTPDSPFGTSWSVLRTFTPVPPNTTYAYPNPFSPDDEPVRFHYATGGGSASVTIEIFDFGMHRVRTLLRNAERPGDTQLDEIWNGRDDDATQVANGVYFYRIIVNDGEPAWGKVMVLQ